MLPSPRFIVSVLLPVLLLPIVGQAANLKVNCGGSSEDALPTINSALKLLNPEGPNTVTVSGSCHENVVIQSFGQLTLVSTSGAAINDASGGLSPVVDIGRSQAVTVQGFTINGGGDGVSCEPASVCYLIGNTVQSSAGQEGIVVGVASRAFLTNNVIENNAQRGLTVRDGAQVVSEADTFRGNAAQGIVVNSNAYFNATKSIVQNNGGDGVGAFAHSTLRLISCAISSNAGNGVTVRGASEATFNNYAGSSTGTGNAGSGVFVGDLSFAGFDPGSNITGNLSGTDVACAPQFPATRGALTNIGGGKTNCVEP